jgi:hypothetical protein
MTRDFVAQAFLSRLNTDEKLSRSHLFGRSQSLNSDWEARPVSYSYTAKIRVYQCPLVVSAFVLGAVS